MASDGGSSKTQGKQRMSIVWKYFKMDEVEPTKVACQMCAERLKFSGSTTSMKYHLRRHASMIDLDIQLPPSKMSKQGSGSSSRGVGAASSSSSSSSSLSASGKASGGDPQSHRDTVTAHLISLLALDYHPPSIVEGEGFRALFNFLVPAYIVPSAQSLSRRISLMHEVYKYRLASELSDSQEVALGIEKWFSGGQVDVITYVTLTVYYITPSWEFQARVLGTEPIDEKSNESVTDVIMALCKSYSIQDTSVVAAIHENDQEVQLSCALVGWHHFPCFAQTLSNCVNGAFAIPEVSEMVLTCRSLVECLLLNPPLGALFELRQKELGLPRHGQRMRTDQRYGEDHDLWAATWKMMDFTQEQRNAFVQTFNDPMGVIDAVAASQLPRLPDGEEWLEIKAVVDALRPLDTVREVLCAESHVSLSTVVPILFSLVSVHLQPTDSDKEFIKSLKSVMVHEMKAQFSFDSAAFTESFGIMATVLDPRHKSLPFLNNDQRNVVKTKLTTLVEDNKSITILSASGAASGTSPNAEDGAGASAADDEDGEQEVIKPKPTVAEFLSVIYENSSNSSVDGNGGASNSRGTRRRTIVVDVRSEVDTYMLEESAPLSANPLDWWKAHSFKYPTLSKLARRMLCIPATAVRPSQAFAGKQISASRRRASLDADLVDKLVFLNGSLQNGVLPTMEKEAQLMQNLACYAQAADINPTDVVIGVP